MYRLKRVSKKEAKFLGVCGGISKYLDPEMDPVVVRIIWVLLTIFSLPLMLIFYFILAVALKVEEPKEDPEEINT